jgi:hypothetical protein
MDVEQSAPNQGAPGDAPAGVASEGAGPAPTQALPTGGDEGTSEERPGAGSGSTNDAFARRPELYVGAAFAGGFAVAQILKRLGA